MTRGKSLETRGFKIPLGKLAPLQTFHTRQGVLLSYRTYPAWSEDLILLYHGVGSDSRYMCVLASAIAEAGIATVVTPDFRGHGASAGSSDAIPANQLEIDLEELLIHVRMTRAAVRVTLAGHSLGGGFVLRIAASDQHRQFSKFIAISPYLPPSLSSFKPGYANFIHLDGNGGFTVNLPEVLRTGREKSSYGAAYVAAVGPPDNILELLSQRPVVALSGHDDDLEDIEQRVKLFAQAKVPYHVLDNLDHLTVVSKPNGVLPFFS